jgi:hypothetical protein
MNMKLLESTSQLKTNANRKVVRKIFGWLLLAGLFPASSAFAALPSFPTSGSCAMLSRLADPVGEILPVTRAVDVLAVLNFTSATTGTMDIIENKMTFTSAPPVEASPNQGHNIAFTVAPSAYPVGAMTITFTAPDTTTRIWNAIAVNNGNTILIQGLTGGFTGVCQF